MTSKPCGCGQPNPIVNPATVGIGVKKQSPTTLFPGSGQNATNIHNPHLTFANKGVYKPTVFNNYSQPNPSQPPFVKQLVATPTSPLQIQNLISNSPQILDTKKKSPSLIIKQTGISKSPSPIFGKIKNVLFMQLKQRASSHFSNLSKQFRLPVWNAQRLAFWRKKVNGQQNFPQTIPSNHSPTVPPPDAKKTCVGCLLQIFWILKKLLTTLVLALFSLTFGIACGLYLWKSYETLSWCDLPESMTSTSLSLNNESQTQSSQTQQEHLYERPEFISLHKLNPNDNPTYKIQVGRPLVMQNERNDVFDIYWDKSQSKSDFSVMPDCTNVGDCRIHPFQSLVVHFYEPTTVTYVVIPVNQHHFSQQQISKGIIDVS